MSRTDCNEDKKDYADSIAQRLRDLAERLGEGTAIGEEVYSGMVFFSYKKLLSDAEGGAMLISELSEKGSQIALIGGGSYDSATILAAASILQRSLTVTSGETGFIELTSRDGEKLLIELDRFRALTAGVLARTAPPDPTPDGDGMKIIFKSPELSRCFSESALISSSLTFSAIRRLTFRDTLISTIPEATPEGLFGGIVAPIFCGGTAVHCRDAHSIIRAMKLSKPTVIFCESKIVRALRKKLVSLCSLPLHLSEKAQTAPRYTGSIRRCLGAAERALRRLLMTRIRAVLGGRLRSIISLGDLPDDCIGALSFFGFECVMLLSTPRCIPAAFKFEGHRSLVWSLPLDTRADLEKVGRGGIGRITLHSPRACERSKSESVEDKLYGFITKNGSIFVLQNQAI